MKKRLKSIEFRALYSLKSSPEIRKPLSTKNKSTPTHPMLPKKGQMFPWRMITENTAMHLRMSSRLFLMSPRPHLDVGPFPDVKELSTAESYHPVSRLAS